MILALQSQSVHHPELTIRFDHGFDVLQREEQRVSAALVVRSVTLTVSSGQKGFSSQESGYGTDTRASSV